MISRFTNTKSFLALALLIFSARFLFISLAPFINNEPNLQLILDGHLVRGSWPWIGLEGSYGVKYGPTALWLYYPVRLFTDAVFWIIFFHILAQGLGLLLFYLSLRKSLGDKIAAWGLLAAIASPFLFFYSRIPWDNTFLLLCSSLVLFLLAALEEKQSASLFLLLGLGCGLTFNTHLMAIPFLLATALAAWPIYSRGNAAKNLALILLPFLLLVVPYLWQVPFSGKNLVSGQSVGMVLLEGLLGLFRYLSFFGMEYFFDRPFQALLRDLHFPFFLSFFSLLLFVPVALGFSSWALRKSVVLRAAFFSCLITLCFYGILLPQKIHPHYLMAVWWVPFLFFGLGVAKLGRARTLVIVALGVNFYFICASQFFFFSNRGTRGPHMGTVQGEIQSLVQNLCAQSKEKLVELDISSVPGTFAYSYLYFWNHEPSCQGKRLGFGSASGRPGREAFKVIYEEVSPSAALRLQKI